CLKKTPNSSSNGPSNASRKSSSACKTGRLPSTSPCNYSKKPTDSSSAARTTCNAPNSGSASWATKTKRR
ncbi:MAG: hypothetical protein AVDCRST_MAG56-2540, partial [uncultured Cytophagales bacterium]